MQKLAKDKRQKVKDFDKRMDDRKNKDFDVSDLMRELGFARD